MIDRIETWNAAPSVFEAIEDEMAKSLASQKEEIEKSLAETVAREEADAQRRIKDTEHEFTEVRRVLADHRSAMAEFHSARDRIEGQIKDHVGKALDCRDTLDRVSSQASTEWVEVRRLSVELDDVRRRARDKQAEMKEYLEARFGIEAPDAEPFSTNSVPSDLDDQVLTLERIREVLASEPDGTPEKAADMPPTDESPRMSGPAPVPDTEDVPGPVSLDGPGAADAAPEAEAAAGPTAADASAVASDETSGPTGPVEEDSGFPSGYPEGAPAAGPAEQPAALSTAEAGPESMPEPAPESAAGPDAEQEAGASPSSPADGPAEGPEAAPPAPEPAAAAGESGSDGAGPSVVGRLVDTLERFRKTEPVVNGTGIEYFQTDQAKVLDGEALLDAMVKVSDGARDLHAQLGGTESLKDLFLIKQEILNEQEVLRKVFFRVVKFCEKEGGSLPAHVREVLSVDILKDSLERLTMGNWSNDEDFGTFMDEMANLRNAYLAVTAGRAAYVRSILEELGVEAN